MGERSAAQIAKDIAQAKAQMMEPGYNGRLKSEAARRMSQVDDLPPDLRRLVHEYGDAVVKQFVNCGIRKASTIRHLIDFVRGYYSDGRPTTAPNWNPNRKRPA